MTRGIRIAGLALAACAASRLPGQSWTEAAVLELFERQSPVRREARAAVAAAVEEMRGRTLAANPAVSYTREQAGFTEFFEAAQTLPLSGRRGYYRRAVEPVRESMAAAGEARLWDTRAALRQAFYRLLAAQQQLATLEAGRGELEEIVRILGVREREGEGSRYDRLRAEREGQELRTDLRLAAARLDQQRAGLLSYLPAGTAIERVGGQLTSAPPEPGRAAWIAQALTQRAELRAETARLAQLDLEERAAGRLRYPEPVISVGLKRTEFLPGRMDYGVVAGVAVPLPLFNKGQTDVARLAAERERVQARRELLTQQVQAAVGGAWDLHAARVEALRAFEQETARTTSDLVGIAHAGYQDGELGILELLDAYRLQRLTRLRRLELEAAAKETEIELGRVAGVEVTR